MAFHPGDIIDNVTVSNSKLPHKNFVTFSHQGITCSMYVGANSPSQPIPKAICLEKNKFWIYSDKNRHAVELINKLYDPLTGYPKSDAYKAYKKKWRKGAFLANNLITISPCNVATISNHKTKFKEWRIISTKDWELPVPVSDYHAIFAKKNPEEQFRPWQNDKIICDYSPPIYCKPHNTKALPVVYNGILHQTKENQSVGVKIVLHGFLSVSKLHCNVRKHIFGCPPHFNHSNEPQLWRKIDGFTLPKKGCKIFQACPDYTKDAKSCQKCNNVQFEEITAACNDIFAKYTDFFVTFFSQALTTNNKLPLKVNVHAQDPFINNGSKIEVVFNAHEIGYILTGVMIGTFYTSDDNTSNVIHLNMLTLYFEKIPFDGVIPIDILKLYNSNRGSGKFPYYIGTIEQQD